ncbi:MAG TPA: hypothetical protein VI215_06860 [Bacteroidota bacterium]|jgi:Spy/CpxP family protein refolding chaperone
MMRYIPFIAVLLLMGTTPLPQIQKSPYAGQEMRPIKSLSQDEIQSYENGEGMGLAKAAELNRYPGPKHVLDMAAELNLNQEQKAMTQKAFEEMHKKAVRVGRELVETERELDKEFASGTINTNRLDSLTAHIGELQGRLRATHLRAHLAEKEILTAGQVNKYIDLRGYGTPEHPHEHMHH